jgi:hypothetical protein
MWLYGGFLGPDGDYRQFYANDLWKYSRATGYWTWMQGSSAPNQPMVYGTLGVAAQANTPGCRRLATSWSAPSGALWLFGGQSSNANFNDLWKYEPSSVAVGMWTWMKGASTVNQSGVYGTRGVANEANTPGARSGAASWTDSSGALWLFGGLDMSTAGRFNDLWKYEAATWTWIAGASTTNQPGVYGTLGTPDAANTPGARDGAVSWMDPSGVLWLFGGNTTDSALNDLWKYDPSTENWTWMKGSSTVGQVGIYGSQGVPDPGNTPGARTEAISWVDKLGSLWLFGGRACDATKDDCHPLNDLWKYDRSIGNWTWMKGSSTYVPYNSTPGVYGTLGVPNAANTPGSRQASVSWTDPTGALWLFGGYDEDLHSNDLWRITLPADTIAPTGTIVINANRSATNSANVTLALTWVDAGGPVARMRFSNDGSTWSAWQDLVATLQYTLPGADGHKTVRVQFIDKANNRSAVYSDYILLDTAPPTGTMLINNNASSTNNTSVTFNLTYTDGAGSGVARMRFSDDGAHWTAWETPKSTRAYILPAGLGYHTVRVQYLDGANNYSPIYNDYIKLVAP